MSNNSSKVTLTLILTADKAHYPDWLDHPLNSGENSKFFYIDTDSKDYELNGSTTIYAVYAVDGSKTMITTFAPKI